MKRRLLVGLCLLGLLVGLAPGAAVAATNSTSVNDIANPDAYACGEPGFIDFEDLADGFNLSSGAIGGVQFTTTAGFTWLVGDFATGFYNGKYPSGGYTSKGTHWAWLGPNQGSGRIDFIHGLASSVSVLTSVNASSVSLEAYDAANNLLATAGPSSISYNTGHMDELKITRATRDIAYVVVHDTGNFFLVDAVCTNAPGVNQQNDDEVNDVPDPDAYTCNQPGFIDFETLADGFNLSSGAIGGVQFTTTGGFTWLVGDFATGFYNGKYPSGGYTSKGTHWAWLGPNQGSGRIDFVNGPASYFSLLASVNVSAVSVEAYDAANNLLATAGPSAINYNTGHMDELKITRAVPDIAYVIVHDTGNFFLVDAICTDAPGVQEPTNQPPTADAGGPYSGDEGSAIAISGTASDPDGDALTTTWSATPVSGVDAGATCSFADASALSTTVTCTDDGTWDLTLSADDGNGGTGTSTTSLTVGNVAPSGTITSPADASVVAVSTTVNLTAAFSDPGSNDTHTCTVDWGEGSGFGAAAGGLACSDSHAYTLPGIYTVTARVTDDDGDAGTDSIMLVVYDPSAGFVTGGGWINSPAGAYRADPELAGKATFGFVSKYKKGATVPDGNTEFQFHAGSFNFHSSSYEWLVVNRAAKNAQFKGTGTVNGGLDPNGNPYKFMIWATDGSPDRFRIRIWYETAGVETVVYDNGTDQAIGSGSIIVHTK